MTKIVPSISLEITLLKRKVENQRNELANLNRVNEGRKQVNREQHRINMALKAATEDRLLRSQLAHAKDDIKALTDSNHALRTQIAHLLEIAIH